MCLFPKRQDNQHNASFSTPGSMAELASEALLFSWFPNNLGNIHNRSKTASRLMASLFRIGRNKTRSLKGRSSFTVL